MTKLVRLILLIAVATFALAMTAAEAQAVPAADTPAVPATTDNAAPYVLGPHDEIQVLVFGQPDMTVKTRINADGTITVPLLGAVSASGKTTAQLGASLAAAYRHGGFLDKPSVTVEVTAYGSKTVTVLGAVPKAGLYALDRPYSVASMVARAGGVNDDGADAVLLTPAHGSAVRIALTDPQGAASRTLEPGDTLFIPPAEMIYVYGAVNKGGAFRYRAGTTYRQAIALAGGPTLAGSTHRIEVRRKGTRITVALDDVAQPEDVLVVKEKLF